MKSDEQNAVSRLNLQIGELVSRFKAAEITEILLGGEQSLLKSQQQQQQQQQQRARVAASEAD